MATKRAGLAICVPHMISRNSRHCYGLCSALAERLLPKFSIVRCDGRQLSGSLRTGCQDWSGAEGYRVAGSMKGHQEAAGGGRGEGAFPVRHQQHVVSRPVGVEAVEVDGAVERHDSNMLPLQSCVQQASLASLQGTLSCHLTVSQCRQ